MTESFRALWLIVRTSVRAGPAQSLISGLETLGRIFAVLQPLYMAWFVTGVVQHDLRLAVLASVAFVVSLGLYSVLIMLGTNARVSHSELVGFEFDRQIAAATASVPTLDHLESPKYLNELQALQDQQSELGRSFSDLLDTANFLAFMTGAVILAASADWRLLFVAVAGVPATLAGRWAAGRQARAEDGAVEASRQSSHLLSLGLSRGPGAEMRVFGTARPMRRRLVQEVRAWRTAKSPSWEPIRSSCGSAGTPRSSMNCKPADQ
jgi:ATP-binding cassette subfamily B protein